jgi:hypothetical protein
MASNLRKDRSRLAVLAVVAILAVTVGTATNVRAEETDPTGVWLWPGNSRGDLTRTFELTLSRNGERLVGSLFYYNDEFPQLAQSAQDQIRRNVTRRISDGTIQGDRISFKIVRSYNGRRSVTTYTGKIEGNRLEGTIGSGQNAVAWEAARPTNSEPASTITGSWTWSLANGTPMTLRLTQDGEQLTGVLIAAGMPETVIENGRCQGNKISFRVSRLLGQTRATAAYAGTVTGDTIKGGMRAFIGPRPQNPPRPAPWNAKRVEE